MSPHSNVGPLEEKHPFLVRLAWITLLVVMAMLILGIFFERRLSAANHQIESNDRAITISNNRVIELAWATCQDRRKSRFVTIHNDKATRKLYAFFTVLAQNSVTAATITAADPKQTPEARAAARQRITDGKNFLSTIPNIVIPRPIGPCGLEPFPGLLPQKIVKKGNSQ